MLSLLKNLLDFLVIYTQKSEEMWTTKACCPHFLRLYDSDDEDSLFLSPHCLHP